MVRVRDLLVRDLAMRWRDSLSVTSIQRSRFVLVMVGVIRENALQMQANVLSVVALNIMHVIALLGTQQRILLLVKVMVEVVIRVLKIMFRDNHSILVQLLAVVLRVTKHAVITRVLGLVEVVTVV